MSPAPTPDKFQPPGDLTTATTSPAEQGLRQFLEWFVPARILNCVLGKNHNGKPSIPGVTLIAFVIVGTAAWFVADKWDSRGRLLTWLGPIFQIVKDDRDHAARWMRFAIATWLFLVALGIVIVAYLHRRWKTRWDDLNKRLASVESALSQNTANLNSWIKYESDLVPFRDLANKLHERFR